MSAFPCDRCGRCCRRELMKPAGLEYLCGPDPEGTCVNLTSDGGCAIYSSRPSACSVESTYVRDFLGLPGDIYSDVSLPRSVYHGLNRVSCHRLQREHGWKKP